MMEVLFLLCFMAGQFNSASFLDGVLGHGETLFLSSPQGSWQKATLWTCAPPATLMPRVTKRRMVPEKFATANTGLLEMGGLSV